MLNKLFEVFQILWAFTAVLSCAGRLLNKAFQIRNNTLVFCFISIHIIFCHLVTSTLTEVLFKRMEALKAGQLLLRYIPPPGFDPGSLPVSKLSGVHLSTSVGRGAEQSEVPLERILMKLLPSVASAKGSERAV